MEDLDRKYGQGYEPDPNNLIALTYFEDDGKLIKTKIRTKLNLKEAASIIKKKLSESNKNAKIKEKFIHVVRDIRK